ncbi:hypothetical protein Ais01nite_76290 [Asanoa ishikariensis]|uniref:DUF2255 family protein n=1 Tax=Asanoa ishikariensis TaxID=137265 RepID=A0A1H3L0R0_9ACTN|nr:DUF2255 family protein [Asanoa ishikariensis]GIF69594.1 hypothetical protein Ais01nite_76290 [Asanoa ishikariensis]SDY57484.1 hypothetical protein SAMN05421684_0441 [Asanoa ishikariensis]
MGALDYFADIGVVHIATDLRSGGEVETPIWAVVVAGVPYVRSGYGPESKWYRRAVRTWHATFVDGRNRYPAALAVVTDEPTLAAVDEAYRAKYAGQSGTTEMVAASARECTLRVVI